MTVLRPIRRLAIVNRGEAAMRCIRSVKALRAHEGSELRVIALYTDVDRAAPFVRHADHAFRLPVKTAPVASYLDHDLLVDALRKVEADAVWPGWGFVAESADLADRLAAEGIAFLGPTGDTMRRLGDKIASKLLAENVGVPVTEWSGGVVSHVADAKEWAQRIGTPLVIKASAGGGGRGIRVVEAHSQVESAFQSAASEAKSAFGDDRLFLESMVVGGRHIEVQILADQHGFVRALGCRDCSVQRRHQKVIEEAPPSNLSPELMQRMKECAESLAREVGYSGVGTVEFLVKDDAFFFLEMNPRLQVEHGITEQITGLDLVEQQIRVARGERLEGLQFDEHGYCIEARVCAEDPDQGFLPAPGRIARFDPALGPSVRIDTGVVTGTTVPAAFDSLIAKVMASGNTREQARSRLLAALRDTDLVIEGGATNKGYLLELLQAPAYREGAVDTRWLDRWNAERTGAPEYAGEAFVLAAVLGYRAAWHAERRSFFADTSTITPDRVPAPEGRELDLEYRGQQYRVRVFSVGSWRYRVHMGNVAVSARFGESGELAARVVIGGRYHRAAYDITDSSIRIELEGCVHRFGRQTAGQVRAGAPSMVVSVDVKPGDRVVAGQSLGLLEAMKMEIAFSAPVAGVVTEVRAAKGQQVAAGDVLLVIDASVEGGGAAAASERLALPQENDPFAPLFTVGTDGWLGKPDLLKAERSPAAERAVALASVSEEIERIALGFDVYPPRFEKLLEFLEAPLPASLSKSFLQELAAVRVGLNAFVDVEQLFSRARHVEDGGRLGPSHNARLRVYLRRIQSSGAGISNEFLELVRAGLRHYGVGSLDYTPELERAVLRMFASQKDPTHRHRLVMVELRRLLDLVGAGVSLGKDPALRDALTRIAAMRGEVSNAIADNALEALYRVFQGPELARQAERTSQRLMSWLEVAEGGGQAPSPPVEVLEDLALCAGPVFSRVEEWLRTSDRWRKVIALSAFVRRFYAPKRPEGHRSELVDGRWFDRSRFDGKLVLAASAGLDEATAALKSLAFATGGKDTLALELIVTLPAGFSPEAVASRIVFGFQGPLVAQRLTLSFLDPEGSVSHISYEDGPEGLQQLELYGLHPETAGRIDLPRYRNFKLERVWGPADVYCFYAVSRQDPEDRRLFVLGDVRARPTVEGNDGELYAPIFERAFQEATRTLRLNLGTRDPRRELHWNRVVMHMAHPIELDPQTAQRIARKLLSNIRHLGVEKTIVRLKLQSKERSSDPPREVEVVGSDLASSRLELSWRRPRRQPLVPASPYERKVADARRKGLVYPYEIVRMLTTGDERRERTSIDVDEGDREPRPVLPVGSFEEFDVEVQDGKPVAVSVAGRDPGQNSSAVIFGILRTPTAKVPEGMRRVLLLSDPTRGMGALGPSECDRVVAAIDLAERLMAPVEWVPVSSGARIAMDSGTENLDATARVVKRIVTFTQGGGVIHLIITGVNVGAQSYWDSLATMLMHTRGLLIMTPNASMVLTGSAALAASGSVSAEDEVTIGGHERVMGPNGQAQFFAPDLLAAFDILYRHYEFTYVVPGESTPRRNRSDDPSERDVRQFPYLALPSHGEHGFSHVGDIFDDAKNPGRKRPFAMRSVMRALIDQDGGHLERWSSLVGAETAIVWDAHIGGYPVMLLGIESQNTPRMGYRPFDGPEEWNGGTLFPLSSKKVARSLNAASGNRPAVILANLSGFDGSPESMRKLQLEYGAEIARAVVNFRGPIVFLVVSRYHGGAYVVFSRELNGGLRALALEGSFASVIGGGPAATVVFPREVRARVAADPRIEALRARLKDHPSAEARAEFDRLRRDVTIEKRAELAAQFDAIHSVERAKRVGSLEEIISAVSMRPFVIQMLSEGLERSAGR